MIGPDDEPRILALLRGDHVQRDAGLRELFQRCRSDLFGLALRLTGRVDLADDALQETMVDVLRGLDGFRGEARLSTWLLRIAVRASLGVAGRARDRVTVSLEEWGEDPAPASDPLEAATRRDDATRVLAAIALLPPRQRAVVALCALDDMPLTDVARVLGIPEGTVHSRLSAARARLRDALGIAARGEALERG